MTQGADRTTFGILLMIAFTVVAPLIDTFAKLVADEVSVGQVSAARFTVQAGCLLPIAWGLGALHRPLAREIRLHLARAALILVATGCFVAALRHMAIADAMAIFFVEPFMLTLLGGFLLGETVGWRRIAASVVGFAGALLVIQPRFAHLGAVTLLPLGTAFFFSFYMLLTRRMAQAQHPVTLQAYTALAAMALIWPALLLGSRAGIAELVFAAPTPMQLLWLAGVGVAATVAHLFVSFALRFAPAAAIAPIQYLEIVAATIIGYLVFNDLPDATMILGVAIIVISGLYVFAREARMGRAKRPTPAP